MPNNAGTNDDYDNDDHVQLYTAETWRAWCFHCDPQWLWHFCSGKKCNVQWLAEKYQVLANISSRIPSSI